MMHPKVLCLGEILLDCLADQSGLSLDQVNSWTAYPGGAPANVACALTKLGTPTSFIGCVGQDGVGEDLIRALKEVGVGIEGVQRHPTAPTRQVLVTRSETGERNFAGFKGYPTNAFADTRLQAEQIPTALFEAADYLVLGTLALAYPESQAAIAQALTLANEHYVKIVVDVNWRLVFWQDPNVAQERIRELLGQVDFLKVTVEEAEWLFHSNDPVFIAEQLDNLEGVLVTDGDRGCTYYLSGQSGSIPAFPVKTVDTTGTGDSFVAGFLHQLCQMGIRSLKNPALAYQIIRYASAVGALTATKPGAITAQPTAAEVDAFLAKVG